MTYGGIVSGGHPDVGVCIEGPAEDDAMKVRTERTRGGFDQEHEARSFHACPRSKSTQKGGTGAGILT